MVFKGDKHVNAVKEIPKLQETCRIITLICNTKTVRIDDRLHNHLSEYFCTFKINSVNSAHELQTSATRIYTCSQLATMTNITITIIRPFQITR